MRKVALVMMVVLFFAAAYYTLRSPVRYGTYGDDLIANNCPISGGTFDTAPSERALTLTNYYLFSQSIDKKRNNWGHCPYQEYKAKTAALELWLVPLGLSVLIYKKKISKK